jgi:hypothetical protein
MVDGAECLDGFIAAYRSVSRAVPWSSQLAQPGVNARPGAGARSGRAPLHSSAVVGRRLPGATSSWLPVPASAALRRVTRTGERRDIVLVGFMIAVHDVCMLFTPCDEPADSGGHVGFVAGRYRDGAYSDVWTDVRRCADATFTAYAPACSCGWQGAAVPITDVAVLTCHRAWRRDHADRTAAVTADLMSDGAGAMPHRGVTCAQLRG